MNQKGFANIIIVIVGIIVLAGAVGYFALRKPAPELTTPSINDQATQTQATRPAATAQTPVSNSQPSITVLSPNGGEMWAQGTTRTIKWSAPSSISDVKIFIEKAPCKTTTCQTSTPIGYLRTIASVPNTGSYVWIIPNCTTANPCSYDFNIPVATDYLIRVSNNDERLVPVSDTSDTPFTITTTEQ